MQNSARRILNWDLGISDMIEEAPQNTDILNTKVYPFIHRDKKTYMVRPEPSWETE